MNLDKIIELILKEGNVNPEIHKELSEAILNYGSEKYVEGAEYAIEQLRSKIKVV